METHWCSHCQLEISVENSPPFKSPYHLHLQYNFIKYFFYILWNYHLDSVILFALIFIHNLENTRGKGNYYFYPNYSFWIIDSTWVIYIVWSSSSFVHWFFSSFPSILLLSLSIEFLILVIIFSSSKISIWFFFISSVISLRFSILKLFVETFCDSSKSLSDYFNICIMLVWASANCLLKFKMRFSWFLV